MQASWAAFDLMEGGRPNFKNEQRDNAKIDTLRKSYEPYYKKLQDQVKALNKDVQDKQKRQVVYLVPVGRESARNWHIKTVRAGPYGFIPPPQRFRFRVPAVPTGRYTLAILVRTNDGTWHNILKGLWRAPNLAPYLILRVR